MKQKYTSNYQILTDFPLPEETSTYVLVSNMSLLSGIGKRAREMGLKKVSQRFRASSNGVFTGVLSLEGDDFATRFPGMGFQIGFVNSYNKSRSLNIAVGASIFICENGMVLGDAVLKKKHQGTVIQEMNTMLDNAFESQYAVLEEAKEFKAETEQVYLSEKKVAHLLGELLYNYEILSPTEISAVTVEIKKSPNFKMTTAREHHAWNFYNNITEVLKNVHPNHAIQKDRMVHNFFNGVVLGKDSSLDLLEKREYNFSDPAIEVEELWQL